MKLTEKDKSFLKQQLIQQLDKELETVEDTGVLKIQYNVAELFKLTDKKDKPIVVISAMAWLKLRQLTTAYKHEVAAHGVVTHVDNVYWIYDILVYPQKTTSVHVESDDEHYAKWLMDLPDDVINNIRFQYHSHPGRTVSPSATDIANQQDMIMSVNDYYIFMIGCNDEDTFNIWFYDKENNIIYEPKDINLLFDDTDNWLTDNDKYIAPLVNKYTPPPVTPANTNWYDNRDRWPAQYGYSFVDDDYLESRSRPLINNNNNKKLKGKDKKKK